MENFGAKNETADLAELGLSGSKAFWNQSPAELVEKTLSLGEGILSDTGALVIKTGKFTGRSPKDRYIVRDDITADSVDWGAINFAISPEHFDGLYKKVVSYLSGKDLYVRDAYACADPKYRLNLRLVAEHPWQSLFAHNMFLRPSAEEIARADPEWTILAAPGCLADPEVDGTVAENFAIINFSKKTIIIGGTAYTGEIKKGIFSVLNYSLPRNKGILSMHCSSNIGQDGDTAVFFGLSGTGKTTLSADPARRLIGDDEHGWSEDSVFNFEGGCYAKCIDLSAEKEPDIFAAVKFGALLENIVMQEGSRSVDYTDTSITQNTRVSYPIYHISNIAEGSRGGVPNNIFFLTADAFGVLPPISRLEVGQAMYHFISGYTAKVAGTEAGVTEPQATFSACFGAPFLPLHPTAYAEMLGKKLKESDTKVWLVNTGWSGGPYGIGSRMSLKYTRAMISAALEGKLDTVKYQVDPVFGLHMPETCENVPAELLNPRNTWSDKNAYDIKANDLAKKFLNNFAQFESAANEEILAAAPRLVVLS